MTEEEEKKINLLMLKAVQACLYALEASSPGPIAIQRAKYLAREAIAKAMGEPWPPPRTCDVPGCDHPAMDHTVQLAPGTNVYVCEACKENVQGFWS